MIITYHGGQFVKISQGDTVIAANPFGKNSAFKPIRFGARIGLVSVGHKDYNGVENLSHGDKVPFIVSGHCECAGDGDAAYLVLAGTGNDEWHFVAMREILDAVVIFVTYRD